MSLNGYISSRRMYSINSYNKNRGSPDKLSQERCLIKEILENAINRHLQFPCQYPHENLN